MGIECSRDAPDLLSITSSREFYNGMKLYVMDPRKTSSAQWADGWLGLDVGSDIALANGIAREILAAGLEDRAFIDRATSGFEEFRTCVDAYTLERTEQLTGVPAHLITEFAHAYAKSKTAQLCWTLGITEHHNAVDNVRALINLALLTGHVGRHRSGLCPLRQGRMLCRSGGGGGRDSGQVSGRAARRRSKSRARSSSRRGASRLPAEKRKISPQMFDAIERGELDTVYIIGENPAQSEADQHRTVKLLQSLKCLIVQDIFLTKTGQLADVVFPASSSWCESEGTVTNSERRVQRVRKALEPPGDARDDIAILFDVANRMGFDWGEAVSENVWDEVRSLSHWHGGMSYARLEELDGIQWPCPDETHPGAPFLHDRLWEDPIVGPRAPFAAVEHDPPVEGLDAEYPIRLTTGRRLDSFNTGVQSGGYTSPLRRGESLDISPEDAAHYGVQEGQPVRISSRRGSVIAPVRIDRGLRAGLVFMTPHFNDEVATNLLTIDATDPVAGTAEFKAAAVRIDRV